MVVRSHGVPRSIYDEIEARGLTCQDATCPFVKKIQDIAAKAEADGAVLLVAGNADHPEVQGIVGHTRGEVFVFGDLSALQAWKGPSDPQKPIYAVAQTTFQVTKWRESSEFLKKAYKMCIRDRHSASGAEGQMLRLAQCENENFPLTNTQTLLN